MSLSMWFEFMPCKKISESLFLDLKARICLQPVSIFVTCVLCFITLDLVFFIHCMFCLTTFCYFFVLCLFGCCRKANLLYSKYNTGLHSIHSNTVNIYTKIFVFDELMQAILCVTHQGFTVNFFNTLQHAVMMCFAIKF